MKRITLAIWLACACASTRTPGVAPDVVVIYLPGQIRPQPPIGLEHQIETAPLVSPGRTLICDDGYCW